MHQSYRYSTVIAAVLVIFSGTGVAAADGTMPIQEVTGSAELDQFVEQYNVNAEKVPGLIASIIGNERINLHVEHGDDEHTYGLVMQGVKIDRVKEDGIDNPTLEMYTDAETLQAIARADNPRRRAVHAFNADQIGYETNDFGKNVKFGAVSLLMRVQALF